MDDSVRVKARQLREAQTVAVVETAIDSEVVRRLALLQCNLLEIASFLGVSEAAIAADPRAMDAYRLGVQKGRRSLRRKAMQMAMGGDRQVLIWLTKNYLGMKDAGSMVLEGGDKPLSVNLPVSADVVAEALAILTAAGAVKNE